MFALEHYNPLNMICSFGEQGINPIYISVKRRYEVACRSKYISTLHRVDSVEEGYKLLMETYGNEEMKPYIVFSDDKSVGVSQWITDEAKKSVFKNARSVAIHNGINTDFFHPVNSDLRKKHNLEGKFVILAPANKWFLDINRETFDYFASHITDDMRMVFIGSGTDESRLTDRMINIGFVSSREEIREIFSACDVMVNCTREESLSLLNVEVQSCGTPVVTYSNTGVKETVDGKCGFAVENGNPIAAWNAMMEIKAKGKSYYLKACQLWAKQEFDKDTNYQKYIDLYKSIV